VATLMVTGSDLPDAWNHRERVIREIQHRCGLTEYRDTSPQEPARNP